jgi:glutamate formiminotransferase/formiminotetrahydrofolate cyclodeaminase
VNDFSELSVREFLSALASSAPTPGGGTAAAIAGAMGAALAEMVGALTLSREKFAPVHDAMRSLSEAALRAREDFLVLAREDSEAYDAVLAARRLPKETEEEREARAHAIESAGRLATEVPMRTARAAARLLAHLPELSEKGNPNALSDAGAATLMLSAAAEGALLNVEINLPGISDAAFVEEMRREAAATQAETRRLSALVLAEVAKRI